MSNSFHSEKKVAKENQDKWGQKIHPFLKGFLARCQNVSLSISYFVFMFCFIFFMTQLGQKMRSTFSFYFVMTDMKTNIYPSEIITTLLFQFGTELQPSIFITFGKLEEFKIPVRWRLLSN